MYLTWLLHNTPCARTGTDPRWVANPCTATATRHHGPVFHRQTARAAAQRCTTARVLPSAHAAPPGGGVATHRATAAPAASRSSVRAPPATSRRTAGAAPTARCARARRSETAAQPTASAETPRIIAMPGASLNLEPVQLLRTSRAMASVVPTARPVQGRVLEPAARPAATVVPQPIIAALDANLALAPVPAVATLSRRMVNVAQTARHVSVRPSEPAAPPPGTVEARQIIAAPGVNRALASAAAVATPSRRMASVAQTAKHVQARISVPAVRPLATVASRVLTVVLVAKARSAHAAVAVMLSRPMASVARTVRRVSAPHSVLVAQAEAIAAVRRTTAARDGES
jgi:hypothetical protein